MDATGQVADVELSASLASAAAGDEAAFTRIVARYQQELFSIAVLVTRDRSLAEDAVQSAWAIAWRKLHTVRSPERLRAWLATVTVNEAKLLLRKRRRRADVEFIADTASAPGGVDPSTGVAGIDLRAAIERLDPDDRALLAMRYVAGFKAPELAAVVGISPGGVRTRLKRLLDGLRQELDR
jgi:RNA polymerase sigma-70 factor (ECF subfamily)